MQLKPNTLISHFKILSEIGKGGMGEVFLAEDTKLNRKVAVKTLPAEFAADKERMRRQGIKAIEKGDVVLFYTGWLKLIGKDNKRFITSGPGLGRDGARYLASRAVALVGMDTSNFEVIPFEN